MSRRKETRLETICYTSDEKEVQEQQMPDVSADTPNDIIQYGRRTFEVPAPLIYYHAQQPDNLKRRIKAARKEGMQDIDPDGTFGCMYCDHYAFNVHDMFQRFFSGEQGQPAAMVSGNVEGDPGFYVEGCQYSPEKSVKWSVELTHRATGEKKTVWRTPCVMYDTMLKTLVEKGALTDYEVPHREHVLETFLDLIGHPERQTPQDPRRATYREQEPRTQKKKGLLARLKGLFKKD